MTWAAGDYAAVARKIEMLADDVVAVAGIEPGTEVLDVATGTGNTALVLAGHGAKVTGLDLTPELFETARRRAAEAGVDVEWVAGDAEELPFEDASFDRVVSTVGIQFAPRHQVVADELTRVCRPGGRIVLVNWTAEGMIGRLFKLMGGAMPPPPDFAQSPALWGREDHMRELFEGHGVDLSFERKRMAMSFGSPEEYVAFFEDQYGPTLKAKEALEPQGRWDELREQIVALAAEFFDDGQGVVQEYFVVTGDRR